MLYITVTNCYMSYNAIIVTQSCVIQKVVEGSGTIMSFYMFFRIG